MKPTEASHTVTQKLPPKDEAPDIVEKPPPTSVSSSAQSNSSTSLNRQSNSTQSSALMKPPSGVSEISADTNMSPQPHVTVPPAAPQVDTNTRKEEEPNMEHFEKAAENLVASLDDDEEEEEKEVI